MTLNELSHVTDEFLKQSMIRAKTKRPIKKGGPYSKTEKEKRLNEVYRLYFEYGYSARKISELMKVNRNTINGDINYWYSNVLKGSNLLDPEYHIITIIESMKIQIARLREQIDKSKSNSEKISIERLMYDINSKILYTWEKLASSTITSNNKAVGIYNKTMKANNQYLRKVTYYDTLSVSEKAQKKIIDIVKEDRARPH